MVACFSLLCFVIKMVKLDCHMICTIVLIVHIMLSSVYCVCAGYFG